MLIVKSLHVILTKRSSFRCSSTSDSQCNTLKVNILKCLMLFSFNFVSKVILRDGDQMSCK